MANEIKTCAVIGTGVIGAGWAARFLAHGLDVVAWDPGPDAEAKLKQARLSKNAHVMMPDKITFEERMDKNGRPFLEIRYYDVDAKYLSEAHFFTHPSSLKKFNINFLRSHLRRPELADEFQSAEDVVKYQKLFRLPAYVIARKQDKFWKITEKVFAEEVETVLRGHPSVADAVVVGAADPRFGHRVAAVVTWADGAPASEEALTAHCRERLAGYKVPRAYRFVDAVRRTPVGKPDYAWARTVVSS